MSLPPPLPSGHSGPGHGPFGEKAFKGALIGCGALVVLGPLLVLIGGEAVASVGTSFLVLGLLGLVTGAVGLLAERHILQRRGAPPDRYRRNGRGPHPLDSRIVKDFRERP